MALNKKIAIVIPFLSKGGAENVAAKLSKGLSQYYDIYLIVFNAQEISYDYKGVLIDLSIDLSNRKIFYRLRNVTKLIIKLYRTKRLYKIDIAISLGELANIPNILSTGKTIISIRESRFNAHNDLQRRFVNFLIKFLYNSSCVCKIITVSEIIKNQVSRKINKNKLKVIYNPFDFNYIKTLSKEKIEKFNKIFKKGTILINIGRLSLQKGQWYLLRIFAELKTRNKILKLIILGDGELRNKLIDLSNQLGLRTFSIWNSQYKSVDDFDVYFLGFQKNPYNFLIHANLFILTSLWEGFPNVLLEAMGLGIPVISADCLSGPREILAPNTNINYQTDKIEYARFGVLAPCLNKKFLTTEPLTLNETKYVEAIESILKNNKLYKKYKQASIERSKDFAIENIIQQWIKVIDSCN